MGEFVDTYSDDLITIHEARAAAYTHPLKGDYTLAESLLDASFCRMLVVFVGGGIEGCLNPGVGATASMLLKNTSRRTREMASASPSLYQAFSDAGLHVDRQVPPDETPRRRQ